MTLTEEEAWGKICCSNLSNMCMASICMAWRWYKKHEYPGTPLPKEQWTGYCGLGGKP